MYPRPQINVSFVVYGPNRQVERLRQWMNSGAWKTTATLRQCDPPPIPNVAGDAMAQRFDGDLHVEVVSLIGTPADLFIAELVTRFPALRFAEGRAITTTEHRFMGEGGVPQIDFRGEEGVWHGAPGSYEMVV